jgi:hypothetical protein
VSRVRRSWTPAAAALEGRKFAACLPSALASRRLQRRLGDVGGIRRVLAEPVRSVQIG